MVGLLGAGLASFALDLQPQLDQAANGFRFRGYWALQSAPAFNLRRQFGTNTHANGPARAGSGATKLFCYLFILLHSDYMLA